MPRSRLTLFILMLLALVLVPFALFDGSFQALSARTLGASWPAPWTAAVVVALLMGDVLLPIPSSVVSTAAGGLLGFPLGLAANFAGTSMGSALGYLLGRQGSTFVRRRVLGPEELERVARGYAASAVWLIALSRPVPVLAETVTLTGGVVQAPFPLFMGVSLLANLVVSAAYAYAGALAWKTDSLMLGLVAVLALPVLGRWAYSRFKTPG